MDSEPVLPQHYQSAGWPTPPPHQSNLGEEGNQKQHEFQCVKRDKQTLRNTANISKPDRGARRHEASLHVRALLQYM